jgi:ATP phosphoribosyltransferase
MTRTFVFAMPKGRLGDLLLKQLAHTSLAPINTTENSRALTFATGHRDVSVVWLKGGDLLRYVAHGAATFGVVGSDVLAENDDDVLELADLGIGRCTLSLAAPVGVTEEQLRKISHLKLATKYVRATARWLEREQLTAELLQIESSVEIAPKLGLAHAIVDLVQSGDTLRANALHVLRELEPVSARLVMNRSAYLTHRDALRPIVLTLTDAVLAANQRT